MCFEINYKVNSNFYENSMKLYMTPIAHTNQKPFELNRTELNSKYEINFHTLVWNFTILTQKYIRYVN